MSAAEVEHLDAVDVYPNIVVSGEVKGDILSVADGRLELACFCHVELDDELIGERFILIAKRLITLHIIQCCDLANIFVLFRGCIELPVVV